MAPCGTISSSPIHTDRKRVYIRYFLDPKSDSSLDPVKPVNATMQAFETVGTGIREVYNYDQSTPGPLNTHFAMASFD